MKISLNLYTMKNYTTVGKVGLFLLSSSVAYSQINPEYNKNNCIETKYTFSRQGQVEQQFSKKYNEQGLVVKEINTFSSKYTGNYTDDYSFEYNAQGNNTKVTYSQNGVLKKVTQKEYDINGKLNKETILGNVSLTPITQSVFSESGSEQIFFDKDGVTESIRERTFFDKNGHLLTKEIFSATGKLAISEKNTYNAQGKVTQFTHFDAVDNVTLVTNYTYDLVGNITKEATLRNGVLYAETDNSYDTKGNLIKKTRLNGKNEVDYYFTYEYNAKGLMSKENYFYNNQILSYRTLEYDAKDNRIKELFYDSKGKLTAAKEWEHFCK